MYSRSIFSGTLYYLILVLMLSTSSIAQISEAEKLYEQAVYQLEAMGNFEEASVLFNRVVTEYPSNKSVSAKALLKLGICYERLGSQKAEEVYNRVIENFPDQTTQVAEARERLSSLRQQKMDDNSLVKLEYSERYFESNTISPDGTMMAGADFTIGQNIAIFNFNTKETSIVTKIDWQDGWAYFPVWSPDAKELAYIRGGWKDPDPYSVWITTLDGKTHQIYKGKSGQFIHTLDWLPDGEGIVVALKDTVESVLGIVSTRDGKLNVLKQLGPKVNIFASISPDGRYIVYSEGKGFSRDIRIISIADKKVSTLTDNPADDGSPLWSPDGQYIIFQSNRHGDYALWGVAVKDGLPQGLPFVIMPGTQDIKVLNWSEAGLAYNNIIYSWDLYTVRMDSSTNKPIGQAELLNYSPTGCNFVPTWSPDGKYLAFVSSPREKKGDASIMLMPRDNSKIREISIPRKIKWGTLRWTLDSKALGFTYSGEDNKTYLCRVELESEMWESWPLGVDTWTTFDWGADGNSYYYAVQGFGSGKSGIYKNILGNSTEELIYTTKKDTVDNLEPVFRDFRISRDGKLLAFQESNGYVVVLEIATGKSRIITPQKDTSLTWATYDKYESPLWSPDSKKLLLMRSLRDLELTKNITEFYIFDIETGNSEKIDFGKNIINEKMMNILGKRDWSPDGKTVVFNVRSKFHEEYLLKKVIPDKQK